MSYDPDNQSGSKTEETKPETAWATGVDEILSSLGVEPEQGLTDSEAADRLEQYGPNSLRASKKKSAWEILWRQFKSIIVLLLLAAAVVAFVFGEHIEMVAILVVVIVNTAIGFATELRAVRSMEALRQMAEVTARVRRGGKVIEVPARRLVPGDIVLLDAGDLVPADCRVVTSVDVEVDESVLTGESMPVGKDPDAIDAGVVLAERSSMLYRGTSITRGHTQAVVIDTGMETEVGRISELVEQAGSRETALEERLDSLGRQLVGICVALAAAVGVVGAVQGKELFTVIETSIALAVATIPEGLPIVATIALARGVWRMADRNALVRNLAVVETLGSTTKILTDKTGTLTENEMTVAEYRDPEHRLNVSEQEAPDESDEGDWWRQLLEIGALCNNEHLPDESADEKEGRRVGEPMELALLTVADNHNVDPSAVREMWPRIGEEPFDASTKMMATFHRAESEDEQARPIRVAVKGAPEAVLESATSMQTRSGNVVELDEQSREKWRELNQQMASDGLRVLALAERRESGDNPSEDPYDDLTLIGLVGMVDPPREDVRPALDACKHAGIQVVMITGDQPGTALYVARELSLTDDPEATARHGSELGDFAQMTDEQRAQLRATSVFSRVNPEQKLRLVELHQEAGDVVAMTGDGVNDAPALVQSDIGIAMGQRGTQVAREAADMVLGDDRFGTIVAAIEQGRVIFENIRKFAVYLLSCNVSELLIIGIAALAFPAAPLPLTALQILFLNLVTDVFPALALGVGEGDRTLMDRDPRDPEEPILGGRQWRAIASFGALLTVSTLAVYIAGRSYLELPMDVVVSMSFFTVAFGQLWHVFDMRTPGTSVWNNDVTRNGWVWGAVALCVVLTLGVLAIPVVAEALKLVMPPLESWGFIAAGSLFPVFVGLFLRR